MIPAAYLFKSAYSRAWTESSGVQPEGPDVPRPEGRLGHALTALRTASRLTRRDVAERAAMTETAVCRIETAADAPLSAVVTYMRSIGGGVELVLKNPDGSGKRIDFDPAISFDRCA